MLFVIKPTMLPFDKIHGGPPWWSKGLVRKWLGVRRCFFCVFLELRFPPLLTSGQSQIILIMAEKETKIKILNSNSDKIHVDICFSFGKKLVRVYFCIWLCKWLVKNICLCFQWAFGVVLWELMTMASQPYVDIDPFEMAAYLQEGYRISQPINCPDELWVMNAPSQNTSDIYN